MVRGGGGVVVGVVWMVMVISVRVFFLVDELHA